ncbi:MAG: winged helix-turn-helix transcriptional regulator [Candidatus Bathyarchaeia archaeon]
MKVLNAMRFCSCGKYRNPASTHHNPNIDWGAPWSYGLSGTDYYNIIAGIDDPCPCVGSKSWTDLLKITKLPRNTLSSTCRYLTENGLLTRNQLPKHGHHVEYSLNYHRNNLRDFKIQFGARLLAEQYKIDRTVQMQMNSIQDYQKFKSSRSYIRIFDEYPWLDKLVRYEAEFLARQISAHGGLNEAVVKTFKEQRKHWETLRLRNKVASSPVIG